MQDRAWLKNYGDIPSTIDPDTWPSVLHMLEHAMVTYASQSAIRFQGETLTYADLDKSSAAVASYLQNVLGLKRGDRVASMMPNLPAFVLTLLGIIRAGAVQVNVNPFYTPRELEHQLNDAGCEIIVIHVGATKTLADVLPRTRIRHVIVVDAGSGTHPMPIFEVDPRLSRFTPFSEVLSVGSSRERIPVSLHGDDLLFLQYTGGTTGLSKGASLTHRNLVAVNQQIKSFMREKIGVGDDVVVTAIPLYHIFALAFNFITYFDAGAENWLVPNPRDLDGLVSTLKAASPTSFAGVNTLFNALLAHPGIGDVDWSRLRMTIGGGAAVMRATSDRWQALTGQAIREGYGLSETSVAVSMVPMHVKEFTGSCGVPFPSTDVRLLEDSDVDVPVGAPGEIAVRGPQIMRGYWGNSEATRAAFTADGYFRTGDIGVFEESGFLKIVDRKKDMVIVSGFNVYPNEVESVASSCPGVLECACVGISDQATGEAVALYVVLSAGATTTTSEIVAHCRRGLAAYKVPKVIHIIEALPKSSVGKVLRRSLRVQG